MTCGSVVVPVGTGVVSSADDVALVASVSCGSLVEVGSGTTVEEVVVMVPLLVDVALAVGQALFGLDCRLRTSLLRLPSLTWPPARLAWRSMSTSGT